MRILVTDPVAPAAVDLLKGAHEVDVRKLDPDALRKEIGSYDALVVRSETKVTADVLAAASRLKIVGRAGVGVDNIDMAAAKAKGVVVVNAPDASSNAVAELTLGHMLALARRIPPADASTRAGKWEKKAFLGSELSGKTLGLLGMGRIGGRLVEIVKVVGMQVVVYDPYIPTARALELGVVKVDDPLDVARRADFVSVHSPLTPETRGLVGERFLAAMRKTAFVVNCARGGIVDEAALDRALREGRIAGAALDVFEKEPPQGSPLLSAPGFQATPHLGASTAEAQDKAGVSVARSILKFLAGEKPDNVVT